MKRVLVALTAAAALAAGTVSIPTSASANPIWLIPALIGAGVGGVALGGAAAQAAQTQPRTSTLQLAPTVAATLQNCRIMRERVRGGWRRVQVCDYDY